ncbi:MAG TPA: sulfatase-like hydrolase/transferase [Candidatus Binatia bacterium]|nr:sulfatase-like hydrolase/transferase [Candidatus Binatia bacterium]
MNWRRFLAIAAVVVAVAIAGLFAARKTILLHALGVFTDLHHPRAANRPVPWVQGPAQAEAPAAQRPPNIIVILADDLGYNDVSTNGAGIAHLPTPHIDSIARDGVRFERGYSGNAVCSPSRAALMTGRYPSRFGFEYTPTPGNMARVAPMLADPRRQHGIVVHPEVAARIADFDQLGVPPAEVTVAEVLKARGYHTMHIGKWHLGSTPQMRPQAQGFDETLMMESGLYLPLDDPRVVNSRQDFDPIDQFLWPNMRYATSYNGGDWFEPKGYLTDYYTDEAVSAIHANRNRPFFLYLAHWAVHTPLQALKDDYDALAADIPDHRERVYAAMVRALDRSVGRVLQALKDEGLDQNTIVVFTSDNGAPNYIGLPEVNRPFRGWKLTLFEGGVRVPYFAMWPGHIAPGTALAAPVSSLDLLPTFAAAAGATLPAGRAIDGVNLLPYLSGAQAGPPHDTIFWRDGSYRMVIDHGWKLQMAERPKKSWLYHLDADPTEQVNLADKEPARRAELEALLAAHDAQMQEPAWPSFVEMPVLVDKTLDQQEAPDDEFVYWQN